MRARKMILTFKNGRKKVEFEISKRNVKVYKIEKDYKLVQYNFGEMEVVYPYELVYYAELYNGVIVHINTINAEVKDGVEN